MSNVNLKKCIFLIQCLIIYSQNDFVMALVGPSVRPAEPNEFPAVVSIITGNFDPSQVELAHRCTGTLVSKQDVITAEHCTRNMFIQACKILVGSYDLHNSIMYSPMYFWPYTAWIQHTGAALREGSHDVALIKIFRNVPDYVQWAPVWHLGNQMLYGVDTVTATWGYLYGDISPRILHAAPLRILSKEDCENKVFLMTHISYNIPDHHLCTSGNPHVVMKGGDSGGPLLYFGVLVGINSGSPAIPGVFEEHHIIVHMGIQLYYEFILDTLNNYELIF